MTALSMTSIAIGLAALGGGAVAAARPDPMRAWMQAFPRSLWPGRILAAVDLTWAALELNQMHLGMFGAVKVHLVWLTPLAIWLCITYLDELLSPRALGGFLLLLAGSVLDIARWHPSQARLIITVLAYLWIVFGMLLLLAPWWFRRIALVATRTDSMLRAGGVVKALAGIGLILLGLLVY